MGYLNTDLELESRAPFDELHRCLVASGFIALRYLLHGDYWSGWYEANCDSLDGPDPHISWMLDAIEKLPTFARLQWDACDLRSLNIGFECSRQSAPLEARISSRTIARLGALDSSVSLTIYAR